MKRLLAYGMAIIVLYVVLTAAILALLVSLGVSLRGPATLMRLFVLQIQSLGVILPAAWLIWGWKMRREAKASAPASSLRRIMASMATVLLVVIPVLSAMLFHFACVGLTQKVEWTRMVRTCTEIRRIESACNALLNDAGKRDFRAIIASSVDWDSAIPDLLRKGHDTEAPLDPQIRKRLGATYADFANDQWGRPYTFAVPERSETAMPAPAVTVRSLGRDGVPSEDDVISSSYPVMDQDMFEFYDARTVNRAPFARLYTLMTGRKWLQPNEAFLHD